MPASDQKEGAYSPNSLNFSKAQMLFVLGHGLRKAYQELLQEKMPNNFLLLIDRLQENESRSMKASLR